jgi:hypothetical protein
MVGLVSKGSLEFEDGGLKRGGIIIGGITFGLYSITIFYFYFYFYLISSLPELFEGLFSFFTTSG